MKKYLFLFTVLSFLGLASCDDGTVKTYYPDGQLKETYSVTGDSIMHGSYTKLDEEGRLIEEAVYNQGQLDQTRKLYYPNGKIRVEENYNNGKFEGPLQEYDENGNPRLTLNYSNNAINGISKAYYPSGELKEEVTFVDNQENGPFKEYHPNGEIWWEGTYRNGDNEYGLLQEFDTTGTLIKKMMCDSIGLCRTIWKIDIGDIKIEEDI